MASQPSVPHGAAAATFASLPRTLALVIFALLPIDTRLRCAEVSRAWCSMAAEPSLWTQLVDLTAADSDEEEDEERLERRGDALLRAAKRRAVGSVQTLDVTSCFNISMEALLDVVAANAGALQTLRLSGTFMGGDDEDEGRAALAALLAAAPQLQAMYADATCDSTDALVLLRGEPPFGPLRIVRLHIHMEGDDAAMVPVMAAAVAAHESLTDVSWRCARLDAPGALDAAVDACDALTQVAFFGCRLTPASAPALVRLLSATALTSIHLCGGEGFRLLDARAAELLGDALYANSTLTSLSLWRMRIWHDPIAAGTLMSRLVRHRSLKKLAVRDDPIDYAAHAAFAGAALSALIAADAPALEQLSVFGCRFGEAGFGPMFDALPRNTHLQQLCCREDDDSVVQALLEDFLRARLLPALRRNTYLTLVDIHHGQVMRDEICALMAERQRSTRDWRGRGSS
jgi:hypothetical protein